jgi:hypothetical protein
MKKGIVKQGVVKKGKIKQKLWQKERSGIKLPV